ncbi:RIO1 family regulatory kinase/ATPase [Halobaculum sp. MBLA0147]|uniref:RIO1 family regulatory kinase/ATPase domain-containing protein n=1 Tax=Halobaculum sp. MBLA0147 TaxID=3079934 RepID=UPI0035265006
MVVRRLVRGNVSWDRLETVVRELAARYGRETAHVRFLEADNWLSTPFVLDDRYFVKVITRQNSLVHAVFTTGRNLGAVTAGTEGFFDHFDTPYEMAEHELAATERMREVGVNAPEPVEALEIDGLGVLVLDYLEGFAPLDEVPAERTTALAPRLFEELALLHEDGLAHGDLRAENVLVVDDDLYFIDATSVREEQAASYADARDSSRQYDLACALAALEPLVGAREAVAAAATAYPAADLLGAREYLGFVDVRPDHTFDATALRGEIDKRGDDGE